jgi:anti-sigma regulatory factor (Ser/Thr protein kinase)
MLVVEKKIESNFESVHRVVLEIIDEIRKTDLKEMQNIIFKINVMLREVLNNAVEHGNKFDESKLVFCRIEYTENEFICTISDEGVGLEVDEFYNMENGFTIKRRSRGLELITKYGFKYKFKDNEITVKYYLDEER